MSTGSQQHYDFAETYGSGVELLPDKKAKGAGDSSKQPSSGNKHFSREPLDYCYATVSLEKEGGGIYATVPSESEGGGDRLRSRVIAAGGYEVEEDVNLQARTTSSRLPSGGGEKRGTKELENSLGYSYAVVEVHI